MWSDVFVICLIIVFGVSAITLGWEKQVEKNKKRRKK